MLGDALEGNFSTREVCRDRKVVMDLPTIIGTLKVSRRSWDRTWTNFTDNLTGPEFVKGYPRPIVVRVVYLVVVTGKRPTNNTRSVIRGD